MIADLLSLATSDLKLEVQQAERKKVYKKAQNAGHKVRKLDCKYPVA